MDSQTGCTATVKGEVTFDESAQVRHIPGRHNATHRCDASNYSRLFYIDEIMCIQCITIMSCCMCSLDRYVLRYAQYIQRILTIALVGATLQFVHTPVFAGKSMRPNFLVPYWAVCQMQLCDNSASASLSVKSYGSTPQ